MYRFLVVVQTQQISYIIDVDLDKILNDEKLKVNFDSARY